MKNNNLTIGVVGGAGHVGLPLSLLLAKTGFKVHIIDINTDAIGKLKQGDIPFLEEGAEELLKEELQKDNLGFSFLYFSLLEYFFNTSAPSLYLGGVSCGGIPAGPGGLSYSSIRS